MNYQIEKQKGSVKFNFTVPAAEWNEEISASYNKNKGKYNIPGFRKGHAPKKVIESMYGPSVFFDDAFNSTASKAYRTALTENAEVYPVDEPKVDITDFTDTEIKFFMEVTTKPEVKLGEYKGLKLNKVEYKVTDKEITEEIDRALNTKSKTVEVSDRAVKDGDTVTLDYSGSVDGVKFNGGTAANQELVIGSNSFIPGFEAQMVGMKIGETKDLNIKFPDDYHSEELKGKNSVFNVTVHAIKEKQTPVFNDDFAKENSAFATADEYKADVSKRLTETAQLKADNENKNGMIEAIVANCEVEVPDCMVETELDYMLQDFEYRLSYMYGGMKLEDYFKYTNSSREDFRKDRAEEARKSVKTRLVMEEVIKTEKIEATDKEVDDKLTEIAAQANKSLEEYKPSVSPQQLAHIKNDIVVGKTLDVLASLNTFEVGAKSAEKKPAAKATTAKTTTKAKKED